MRWLLGKSDGLANASMLYRAQRSVDVCWSTLPSTRVEVDADGQSNLSSCQASISKVIIFSVLGLGKRLQAMYRLLE